MGPLLSPWHSVGWPLQRLRLNIIIQEEVEEVLSSLCVKDLPVPLRSRAILVMDSIATAREEQSPPS